MSSLEVRHLQVIEAVQRLGTVTRAASSLHLTQPAVSKMLQDMEELATARGANAEDAIEGARQSGLVCSIAQGKIQAALALVVPSAAGKPRAAS